MRAAPSRLRCRVLDFLPAVPSQPKSKCCSRPFSRIGLFRQCPGGGMADAGDLKSHQAVLQHPAPKRSTAKNASVYRASVMYNAAASRTLAKQIEKPTDTTTDTGIALDFRPPGTPDFRATSRVYGLPTATVQILGVLGYCQFTRSAVFETFDGEASSNSRHRPIEWPG